MDIQNQYLDLDSEAEYSNITTEYIRCLSISQQSLSGKLRYTHYNRFLDLEKFLYNIMQYR